jgi:hypothetical protein
MTCPKCSRVIPSRSTSCPSCNALIMDDGAKALLAVGGLLPGGWLTTKLVKKGFSFLKGIDWTAVSEELSRAIELAQMDVNTIKDHRERLNRAEKLLVLDDKISVDQAAMLVCATLEAGLKSLADRHAITLDADASEGMIEIATALEANNKISHSDFQGISQCVFNVRNPVMHGDFHRYHKTDVQRQLDFVRQFFTTHNLTYGFAY